jgi:hypothetical protein
MNKRRRSISLRELAAFVAGLLAFLGLGRFRRKHSSGGSSDQHGAQPAEKPAAEPDESVRRGHEFRDIHIGGVVATGVFLIGALAVVSLGVWGLFSLLQSNRQVALRPSSPLVATPIVPPSPHLQPNPEVDYETLHADQDALLQQYGWVDQQAGTVRIPIAHAMDLLSERGLPTPVPGMQEQATDETQEPSLSATQEPPK